MLHRSEKRRWCLARAYQQWSLHGDTDLRVLGIKSVEQSVISSRSIALLSIQNSRYTSFIPGSRLTC